MICPLLPLGKLRPRQGLRAPSLNATELGFEPRVDVMSSLVLLSFALLDLLGSIL